MITLTDEQMEKYMRLRAEADKYLDLCIRLYRAEQYKKTRSYDIDLK